MIIHDYAHIIYQLYIYNISADYFKFKCLDRQLFKLKGFFGSLHVSYVGLAQVSEVQKCLFEEFGC